MTDKKDWYSQHRVSSFTKPQVRWLIPHLGMIRNGDFPKNPKDTGYTDTGIKSRQFKAGAAFETAAGIAAELDLRIQRAGLDGLLLELLYTNDPDDEVFVIQHIAEALNLETREVYQRIRNALYYVSGRDRKQTSYANYVRDQRYRYLRIK